VVWKRSNLPFLLWSKGWYRKSWTKNALSSPRAQSESMWAPPSRDSFGFPIARHLLSSWHSRSKGSHPWADLDGPQLHALSIDKGISWAYSNGASKDRATSWGLGFIIFLIELTLLNSKPASDLTQTIRVSFQHCSMHWRWQRDGRLYSFMWIN